MKTYKKHHYEADAWTEGKPTKGLLLISYQDGDSFNTCSRCGCSVKSVSVRRGTLATSSITSPKICEWTLRAVW